MNKKAKRDAILAYHEAGHAVVARVLGLAVPHVTILSVDKTSNASALSQSAAWHADQSDLAAQALAHETDAKVALAGPHAQHKYQPVRNIKRAVNTEWIDDMANAHSNIIRALLCRAGVKLDKGPVTGKLTKQQLAEANTVVDQLWQTAASLVEANWPAIERVAKALVTRLYLTQDDIDNLIANRPALVMPTQ